MSTALEAAWADVITNIRGPDAIPALVAVLDRLQALDELKQKVLAEAAAELRGDREPPANTQSDTARWLHQQLAHGERRAQTLMRAAAHDGIGWRSVERVKRRAGVTATRHDRASWWSLATTTGSNSATPPIGAERGGKLNR